MAIAYIERSVYKSRPCRTVVATSATGLLPERHHHIDNLVSLKRFYVLLSFDLAQTALCTTPEKLQKRACAEVCSEGHNAID